MFWHKKKKEFSEISEPDEKFTASVDEDEEEIVTVADIDEDTDEVTNEDDDEDIENSLETTDVTSQPISVKITSMEQLARFANRRGYGNIQFMSKDTYEVFELREAHFRIAEVWGTVTMARECSPEEYARVMLAMELMKDPDAYFKLPGLTENEVKKAIEDFCKENFSINGKKYSNNPSRFTKLLKENDRREEWDEYTKELVYDKLEKFCAENDIVFPEIDTLNDELDEVSTFSCSEQNADITDNNDE